MYVCMYVCICVDTFVGVCMYMFIYIYAYANVYAGVHVYVFVYVYVCVCAHAYAKCVLVRNKGFWVCDLGQCVGVPYLRLDPKVQRRLSSYSNQQEILRHTLCYGKNGGTKKI